MARRGDVFQVKKRIGFSAWTQERVVVLQATRLNTVLPTLLVAPLDQATTIYARNPLAIPVTPLESGLEQDTVLVLTALSSISRSVLEPSRTGQLQATTLAQADRALVALLGLP